ncbi:LptA/OstA family protein [Schwartzia sp. (in: firmicutes)]|nr:organic solvent tolerance protein OstA [Schwartzia sp. (in: firmicutes)]
MKSIQKKSLAAAAAVLMLGISGLASVGAEPSNAPSELNGDVVEYNARTGLMTADGHVVLKHNDGVARGSHAEYNTKTQDGLLTGGVVADQGNTHLTCDTVRFVSGTQFVAEGNVHGTQEDKSYEGPRAEYSSDTEYLRLPAGGTITTADGSFTADYMEGWMKDNHARGVGNAYVTSPKRNFEGGGDEAEYFGAESGKVVLTGNAWAIQDNNRLKSQRLTVYLDDQGKAQTTADEPAEK